MASMLNIGRGIDALNWTKKEIEPTVVGVSVRIIGSSASAGFVIVMGPLGAIFLAASLVCGACSRRVRQ